MLRMVAGAAALAVGIFGGWTLVALKAINPGTPLCLSLTRAPAAADDEPSSANIAPGGVPDEPTVVQKSQVPIHNSAAPAIAASRSKSAPIVVARDNREKPRKRRACRRDDGAC